MEKGERWRRDNGGRGITNDGRGITVEEGKEGMILTIFVGLC